MTAKEWSSFLGDENVLKLDSGNSYSTLTKYNKAQGTVYFKKVDFMVFELIPQLSHYLQNE